MSRAVLISIKPEWCELIASGKKTVEVRKSRPKLGTPFKVYIYVTKTKSKNGLGLCLDKGMFGTSKEVRFLYKRNYETVKQLNMQILSGKVIGELVCNEIKLIGQNELVVVEDAEKALKGSCLSINEIYKYLGLPKSKDDEKYRECFGWRISDLKIYDKPKELSEFKGLRATKFGYEPVEIKRAPQSWCYVEEREDNA